MIKVEITLADLALVDENGFEICTLDKLVPHENVKVSEPLDEERLAKYTSVTEEWDNELEEEW